MLTLDLIQEEDASPEDLDTCEKSFRVDLDKSAAYFTPGRRRSGSETIKEKSKTNSLPRRKDTTGEAFGKGAMYTPQVPKKLSPLEKNKCASMEEILSCWNSSSAGQAWRRSGLKDRGASPEPEQLARIQELVALQLEKTQGLLAEAKGYGGEAQSPRLDSEAALQEIQRLLSEASSYWSQAQKVLQEVTELRRLYQQLRLSPPVHLGGLRQPPQCRRSLM